ncbi:3-dehydroquinate synthase [Flocculibacter collagenilyticus]|uniref:3-dehydroquinate synthase n=1 Tax=Flocculibacter collagenilyticus TaxID=2744479 RepID=UPI0018F6FBEC|nr:3-dehydroquinate synthase [Flocculibacter collagenilyticus]
MDVLQLDLAERSYPIMVGQDLLAQTSHLLDQFSSRPFVIISNETVAPLYANLLSDQLANSELYFYHIPDGEQYKTLNTYQDIITFLLENNIARDAVLLALGGGVVGDIVGFVAATYQRGIDFIQVPTTLLSQVDSSVGGKTAVNHPLGKNMIGAFYQPKAVIIDTNTLDTLPRHQYAAGLAEVVKYGLIYDVEFFRFLESNRQAILNRDKQVLSTVIHRCCSIKASIVAEDEKESGLRAILNLGHTFGHAIEAEMGYGNWLHGEAVAVGIVQACHIALLKGRITQSELNRVVELLAFFNLPTKGPQEMNFVTYMKHMAKDKKVMAKQIRFIIPSTFGSVEITTDVTEDELQTVLG